MSKSNWLKDEDQKGNFSNQKQDTFDPGKGYVGIRLQQGSPLLDRDWNELEDIRRHAEVMLRKYFIGNGVPDENGFRIEAAETPANDFKIFAGRCLVEGFEVVNEPVDINGNPLDFILYSQQEGVEPLGVPDVDRSDTVYLDVWIEEVTGQQEAALNNPQDINVETCTRHKLNWRVKVNEGIQELPGEAFHHYYPIARIQRKAGKNTIEVGDIEDLRSAGLVLLLIKQAIDLLRSALTVDQNGNVGIGTRSPVSKLQVRGESWTSLAIETSTNDPFLQLTSDGSSIINDWTMRMDVSESDKLQFRYDNDLKLAMDTDGNVGIGTPNPLSVIGNGSLKHSLETTGWILARGNGENTWGDPASRIGVMKAGGSDCDGWWISANPNNTFAIHQGCAGDRLTIDSNGKVGIGTAEPGAKLDVAGNISGMSYRNVTETFFVGGDGDKFYAVVFRDDDWSQGPAEFEIIRSNVHDNGDNWGAMNLRINWHGSNYGHGASYIEHTYNYNIRTFVKDIKEYPYSPYLLVWLRGSTTYYYRSLNNRVVLHQILGTNNQSCSFNPIEYLGYNTAFDCTFRPEGCIQAGTAISGDFYVDGRSHAARRTGTGIDYAEYFESKDSKEIKAGISVALDNGKIRPAKKNEIPLGVISANPGIVGGVHIEWPKMYLCDEFGNQIIEEYKDEIMKPKKEKVKKERQKMEKKKVKEKVKRTEVVKKKGKYYQVEVEETVEREIEESVFKEVDLYDDVSKKKIGKHKIPVMETYEEEIDVLDENGQPVMLGTGKFETKTRPKINPDYDEKKEYISREKRPEWNCVGLLGQLPLRKGQPVAPSWIKIKDISKEVELWLVK